MVDPPPSGVALPPLSPFSKSSKIAVQGVGVTVGLGVRVAVIVGVPA
jgi:hypothetical protein